MGCKLKKCKRTKSVTTRINETGPNWLQLGKIKLDQIGYKVQNHSREMGQIGDKLEKLKWTKLVISWINATRKNDQDVEALA